MQLIDLFETHHIHKIDTSNPKRRFIYVDSSVLAKGGYGWKLSDIGVQLLKSGKIRVEDAVNWTSGDNEHSGVIQLMSGPGKYVDHQYVSGERVYGIAAHTSHKLKDAHTRKSDQHLNDILDKLAYGNQHPDYIEYIKKFYPDSYSTSVNMYRVLEIPVSSLYKAKVKSSEDLLKYIVHFKSGYMSWSLKRQGIDYFRYCNTGSCTKNDHDNKPSAHFSSKKDISSIPVLVVLKQRNSGIDITKLLSIIEKSTDNIETNVWLSRKSQMADAYEILSPINAETMEVLSIQVPFKNEHGDTKIANLSPEEISKVYELRKSVGTQGHWDPKDTRVGDRWDTSSIPESFIGYLTHS